MEVAEFVRSKIINAVIEAFQNYAEKVIIQQKQDIFEAEGELNGREPWEPLKESTIRLKQELGAAQPDRILFRFGELYNGFEVEVIPNDQGLTIRVSNDVSYADAMDERSPFMNFTEEDLQQIIKQIVSKIGI